MNHARMYFRGRSLIILNAIVLSLYMQWAYGVTCWEIFSGGKIPYAELMVREIPKLLAEGHRLEKPSNDACSEEM